MYKFLKTVGVGLVGAGATGLGLCLLPIAGPAGTVFGIAAYVCAETVGAGVGACTAAVYYREEE